MAQIHWMGASARAWWTVLVMALGRVAVAPAWPSASRIQLQLPVRHHQPHRESRLTLVRGQSHDSF